MKDLIPVDGRPDLARDPASGAILNINTQEIEEARLRKQQRLSDKKRLDNLEKDVSQIKGMLEQILTAIKD